ncbi:RHS repeat domain-containing protein [Alkalitalea saponilacus]|nr:RHS repeat-associated core domain-containing protein [Alkalitalea saponilacus]
MKSITQGNKSHHLTYGTNQQRIKGTFATSGNTTLTKYYLGNYEEEVSPDGSVRKLHYIYGGNGLAAIMDYSNGQEKLYYTYSDYQGNLLAVANEAGQVVERYAYDPWGARRNPSDWSQPDTRANLLFSRGYTMHEHLDDFGLINMNGRMYDPLMAQFLSPDPFIQAPGNWFNYNRYGYCLNNPLIYNDPSGYIFKKFGRWVKKQWYDAWDGLDQFARWADKKGIPSGGVGIGVQGGSGYGYAHVGGATVYDSRNNNQFDAGVNAVKAVDDVRYLQGFAANGGGAIESSSRGLEFGSKIFEFWALNAYARQSDNWLYAEKFYGSVETGGSSGNPKLLKLSKVGARVNTGASIVTTGFAYGEMVFGEPQPITYVDASVGTVGLVSVVTSKLSGVSIPGVGMGVTYYGTARLGWDVGASFAPKYGLINGYYWERNRHLRPRRSILQDINF